MENVGAPTFPKWNGCRVDKEALFYWPAFRLVVRRREVADPKVGHAKLRLKNVGAPTIEVLL